MRNTIRRIVSISLVILPGLFGAAGCSNPAADVAPAKVSAPAPTSTGPAPVVAPGGTEAVAKGTAAANLPEGAELLPIGPETSKIGFIGSKVTGSHKGGFNVIHRELGPGRRPIPKPAGSPPRSTWARPGRTTTG